MSACLLLLGCNFVAGHPHGFDATVVATGGGQMVLKHDGIEGVLPAGETTFMADPNLGRRVQVGQRVQARMMQASDGTLRVIGVEPGDPTP